MEEVDKKEKIYSPKITIKPVKVPDEEVSTTSDADVSNIANYCNKDKSYSLVVNFIFILL